MSHHRKHNRYTDALLRRIDSAMKAGNKLKHIAPEYGLSYDGLSRALGEWRRRNDKARA